MNWSPLAIVWTNKAARDLSKLARDMQPRVIAAVESFAATGVGNVKKMKDGSGHRLAVGGVRAGLHLEIKAGQVTVVWVDKRGDAY